MIANVTIAVFDNIPSAHIALGRLQAEGIKAWLVDEHIIQADWLYNIPVGGIKLQVSATIQAHAEKILAQDYSYLLDISE